MLSVFKNINRFAGKWKWLDEAAIFSARYLIYLMLGFLLVFSIFVRNLGLFILSFTAGLFALFVVAKIIYFFYQEHRPSELRSSHVLIPVPSNPSFPSSHASFLFGLSFLLLFYHFELGIIFLILSTLVGISRVFCGVHWFHDIVGGVAAGLASSMVMYFFFAFIKV